MLLPPQVTQVGQIKEMVRREHWRQIHLPSYKKLKYNVKKKNLKYTVHMYFGLYMYCQLIFLLLCRRVKEELASISGTINLTVENLRSEPLFVNPLKGV